MPRNKPAITPKKNDILRSQEEFFQVFQKQRFMLDSAINRVIFGNISHNRPNNNDTDGQGSSIKTLNKIVSGVDYI